MTGHPAMGIRRRAAALRTRASRRATSVIGLLRALRQGVTAKPDMIRAPRLAATSDDHENASPRTSREARLAQLSFRGGPQRISNNPGRRIGDGAGQHTWEATLGEPDAHSTRAAEMVATLQKVVHEGNVRRIFIDDEDGKTLIEIPDLLGIRGGSRMEPVWAAARSLSRLATNLSIRVEREEGWPKYDE